MKKKAPKKIHQPKKIDGFKLRGFRLIDSDNLIFTIQQYPSPSS